MLNPQQYKIPAWFLNRQKDIRDGKNSQVFVTIFGFLINLFFYSSCRPTWRVNTERILSAWRKFVFIVVFVIIGVFVYVDNIQRLLAVKDALLEYRKRREVKNDNSLKDIIEDMFELLLLCYNIRELKILFRYFEVSWFKKR